MYDDRTGETGQLTYLLDQISVRRAELEQRRPTSSTPSPNSTISSAAAATTWRG